MCLAARKMQSNIPTALCADTGGDDSANANAYDVVGALLLRTLQQSEGPPPVAAITAAPVLQRELTKPKVRELTVLFCYGNVSRGKNMCTHHMSSTLVVYKLQHERQEAPHCADIGV